MALTFTNWARSLESAPSATYHPTSEAELVSLVIDAAKCAARVKVVGSGHSCSAVAQADGVYLVSLSRYNRVRFLDKEAKLVVVEAGITIDTLNDYLAANQLALSTQASIATQTLAGAISTGTHGGSAKVGALDQQVIRMTIITGLGEIVEASAEVNAELFMAARVGVGTVGIISTLTLRCVDAFNLRACASCLPLEAGLETLASPMRFTYSRLWVLPHADRALLWWAEPTNESATSRGRAAAWLDDCVVGNLAPETGYWLSSTFPQITPFVNRALCHGPFRSRAVQIGRSDKVLTIPISVRQYVMEYGIPAEQGARAIRDLLSMIRSRGFFAHSPIEVRFSPANDAWLSMAYGRATCYIGVITYLPFGRIVPWESYFRQCEQIFRAVEGRPHWAKMHFLQAAQLRIMYPKWSAFIARQRQIDPRGMFRSPYLDQLFGE